MFAIIDHAGTLGADNAALHRIAEESVLEAARQAGFTMMESDNEILNNPADDHSLPSSAAELERNTDRFIVKLTKSGM